MASQVSSHTTSSSYEVQLRRNRIRQVLLETLERRELLAADIAHPVFAPGTTQEYMDQVEARFQGEANGLSGGINLQGTRWVNPVGGPSPNTGDPATVTWSIVPDGTLDSGDNATSNLIAFMDSIYGGGTGAVENRPWFNIFERAYDRWSEVSGLTFVYEPQDDGANMGGTNRGVAGVRGDVRIGGHNIDGDFGVLAYNYYPNGSGNNGFDGDMIIDTNDRWYVSDAPSGGAGLFNVLMHEAGHGIGLAHVIPVNQTKLMEPSVSTAFVGAQHDDILGAHALYGDFNENDDTRGDATDLGDLPNGLTRVTGNSIDQALDDDWMKFTVPSSGRVTVNLEPLGESYLVGPQGGSASQVDTRLNMDLEVELSDAAGNVLALAASNGVGESEEILDFDLPAGGDYFLRVRGAASASAEPQMYDLAINLAGLTDPNATAQPPRLLSVSPNVGEIFSFNRTNDLNTGPSELVFRFDGAQFLDAGSLDGIRITRAGHDSDFTDGDEEVITPGWIGFGDSDRIIVARFATPLPDDQYRVEVFGEDVEGMTAVRNLNGEPLKPRIDGTDRDTLRFDLELGAQVIAVVPQPTSVNADGTIVSARDQIEVYFNNDDLHQTAVSTTGAASDPTVVKPEFYQLILTGDTVSPGDDVVFLPDSISYDPDTDKAVLTFATPIEQLAGGDGTFRLRVGSNTPVNSVLNPPAVAPVTPASDPVGYLSGAFDLNGALAATGSTIVSENLVNVQNQLLLDFPGSNFEPGHRDIQDQNHLGGFDDDSHQITQAFYNFALDRSYGLDTFGQPVFTSITPEQIQRVREIYEFYGAQLGIDFVESESQGMTVVVGDPFPNGVVGGVGGVLGVATVDNLNGLAIMDGAETWLNELTLADGPNGEFSFFFTALHEIGHMLGIGHTYELPDGTIMGSTTALSSGNPFEEIYPGDHDVVHGQHGYRPDNKDVDLYRFDVPANVTGQVSIETIAERLGDSSNADTHLTLLKMTPNGLDVVATNNDYFSSDSFIRTKLTAGTYYIGVTAFGNQDFDPATDNTGGGGVSQGRYDLRVDFVPEVQSQIVDINGSGLDGDGDGLAGGDFNFWFRTATPTDTAAPGAPKTVFVNKGFVGTSDGSEAAPYASIPAAVAAVGSGDIIRITGSVGVDGDLSTVKDNPAYEIGRGGVGNAVLSDGVLFEVPQGVTAMIDAGAIFKMGGSRVVVGSRDAGTDQSLAALQVLGTPDQSVVFTSYRDESFGIDTNTIPTTPAPGQWGGLQFNKEVDRVEGRGDWEREGIFLNYVGHADIRYGGGPITVSTPSPTINPIDLTEARPTLLHNLITFSSTAAIAADPNSFEETLFTEPRYQRFGAFRADYDRVGPDLRGNILLDNSVNGLLVRIETNAGDVIDKLDVPGRFDDRDIVHALGENLIIAGTPGGAFLETTAPDVSVVTLDNSASGSLPPGSTHTYKVTFVDLNGGESIPSAATQTATVAASGGIAIDNLPQAEGDFVSRRLYRSGPGGAGPFTLVAELDGDTPTFTDDGTTLGAQLANPFATSLQRARLDARLTIDPGVIVKSTGSRIEVDISAQLIAEGTNENRVIFTSREDDRYGAGGTFDSNNDGDATTPDAGDWGGLLARHFSSISVDSALITFGGGVTDVPGGFAGFNAIEVHQSDARIANSILENNANGRGGNLQNTRDGRGRNDSSVIFVRGSQPVIINNVLQNNMTSGTAAISIDANSMKAVPIQDVGRQTGDADRLPGEVGNMGPLVVGNRLAANGQNGMRIRGATLTTETAWDDTDIVHILESEIVVPDFHTFGGMRLQSKADESLVVKLGIGAGITADGLPLDITDRIGGSLQILGTPGFPVVMTSLQDDSVGAGFDPTGVPQVDTNGDGASTGAPGQWRGIRLNPSSNDRNLNTIVETESDTIQDEGTNDNPLAAQPLGGLAANIGAGDENLRLGFTVHGSVASTADLDVYSFVGKGGTPVWVDLDRTDASLDSVVELVDVDGNIIALSDNSLDESQTGLVSFVNTSLIPDSAVQTLERDPFAKTNTWLSTTPGNGLVAEVEPNNSFATPQNLDGEQFILSSDPNVELSGIRPYLTLQGTGDGTFDFYSFTGNAGATVTLDIDGASFDTELFLFDPNGDLVDFNDDDGNDPGSGSVLDSFVEFTLPTAGTYVFGVGEFNSFGQNGGIILGNTPDPGDTYNLHVSIDGKPAAAITTPPIPAQDFQSTNPADAGFRVVLPGAVGAENTYYLRVRSSNVAPGGNAASLQDPAQVRDGLTRGAYRMQVRLQQQDEVAGSTVRYADIRNAVNGIEAIGLPAHSPLLGTTSEPQGNPINPIDTVNVGNIANQDRAGVSLAGEMENAGDIDWYRFSVSHTQIQAGNPHVSVNFDVDYADGFGRANTSLWVYRIDGANNMELILVGTDSDVVDDQDRAGQSLGDVDDRSRGSFGTKDPFIGAQELLPGEYVVAVTNNSQVAAQMRQFQEANPGGNELMRLEPIDSIQRIVADRFETANFAETAVAPQSVAFTGNASDQVPFSLADVTGFFAVNEGTQSRLYFGNAYTGAVEAQVGATFPRVHDLALSPDGNLVGIEIEVTGQQTDAANGAFLNIDAAGDGATANAGNTGIQTFTTEIDGNGNFVVRQRTKNNAQVGDGMHFEALTFFHNAGQVATGDLRLFGVAHRGTNRIFDRAILDGNNAPIGRVSIAQDTFVATNHVYRLDPASGAFINPTGTQTRTGNFTTQGAGTQAVEFYSLVTANPFDTVTGLAMVHGQGGDMVAVSDAGEFFRFNTGNGTGRVGGTFKFPIATVVDPDTAQPVQFSGLMPGPKNLEGGRFDDIVFGTTTNGTIYALNALDGSLAHVFPGGNFKVSSTTDSFPGSVQGADLSPLDVNLWHLTDTRGNDAGHGRPATHNNLRPNNQVGENSLYFGFENAGNDGGDRQAGDWDPIHSVYDNTYNLPGGAHGAIESLPLDLSQYSIDDLPTLYFNYYLETQNQNSEIADGDNRMQDAFRVYAAGDNGQWILLSTNNSDVVLTNANNRDEFDVTLTGNFDDNGRPYVTQEAFDVGDAGAPDAWRQIRAPLAAFAGQRNVKLRFEFSSGASFRTNDPNTGGVELSAVEGWRIGDGDTFTIQTFDQGATQQTTFEFDLGLVLQLPSGGSISDGNQLIVDGTAYTFSQTQNGPTDILYSPDMTPAQVANAVAAKMPFATATNAERGNTLNIDAPIGGVYSTVGLRGAIQGIPGVAGNNEPVRITQADSVTQVRDAVRAALANRLNRTGQENNLDVWPVYDATIKMHKYEVVNDGPLTASNTRIGDAFGVDPRQFGLDRMDERAQQNAFEGVFIDDILVGLAERGEAALNSGDIFAPGGVGQFFASNLQYEPSGFGIEEAETGRYQLDIRTAADYGWTVNGDELAVTGLPPGRSFDSNDRLAPGLNLEVVDSAGIRDGATFTLSDGINQVTFEFDVPFGVGDPATGVTSGNIAIPVTANSSTRQLAEAIRDAINGPTAQAALAVSASVTGNGTTINLAGPAALTRGGLTALTGIPGLRSFRSGSETFFGEDHGDTNRLRDQGMVLIESTYVRDSSGYGIVVDAAPRNGQSPTTPGAPIHYPTNNPDRLAPGVVIVNNVLDSNTQGGILISGDPNLPSTVTGQDVIKPSTVARVVNNTVWGGSTGILVNDGASPIILNNIVANANTGINVAGAQGTFVLGANLYYNNATPVTPAGAPETFRTIATVSPFVDGPNGNFYLVPGAGAIDSSRDSLAELASLTQIKSALGLPPSPTLAPERDIIGQRRVDDTSVSTSSNFGVKDRGAFDRADFVDLEAVLQRPLDNDSENVDVDRTVTYVRLEDGTVDYFEILLLDPLGGTGPDPLSVTPEAVLLTENGRTLTAGVDYVFGYNTNSRTVRLTPLSGVWRPDSVYEITLNNQNGTRIFAPDGLSVADGDTFDVTVGGVTTTFEWDSDGNATETAVPFDPSFTQYEMAARIMSAFNALGGGVEAYLQGDNAVMVTGAGAINGLATVNVGAIRDIAGNNLAPNRSSTLTQFTIVMPEMQLDYGDAPGANSTTLQANNGSRHAILPIDAPHLALGVFADGDNDGQPSTAARADDNQGMFLSTTIPGVTIGSQGAAVLAMPVPSAALDGQLITITDDELKTVVFEFDNDGSTAASSVAVDFSTAATADDVATALTTAVNNAVLSGLITDLSAFSTGAQVDLGGTPETVVDLSAATSVTRVPVGSFSLEFQAGVFAGGQQLEFMDGQGTTFQIELEDTSLGGPALIADETFLPVPVDLSTATDEEVVQAIADVLNTRIAAGTLALGPVTVDGLSLAFVGDDEDGVSFGAVFNANSKPVPITVTSTGAGILDVWFDWNADGDFSDAGERIVSDMPIQAGETVIDVVTPASAAIGFTTSRFRLSTTGNLELGGLAIGGEVEDHLIEVVAGTPPVANDDEYDVLEDDVLDTAGAGLPGVLDNDTDVDSVTISVRDEDVLTPGVQPVQDVSRGTLVLNADGSFTYTPDPDFFGTDTFVYNAIDTRLSSVIPATVTINVRPVNDAPTAIDDTLSIFEDQTLVAPGDTFTSNDFKGVFGTPSQTNELGQTLTIVNPVVINHPDPGLVGGTVTVINNELTFIPPAHYNDQIDGPVEIEITIQDNGQTWDPVTRTLVDDFLTATSTLTINVVALNDSPEYQMPASVVIDEEATSIDPFITGIVPGPTEATDEGTGPALAFEDQSVTFTATALDPSLFVVQPTIDPATGVMSFQLNEHLTTEPPFAPEILVEIVATDSGAASGVIRNLFDPAAIAGADTYDGATLTISDLNGNTLVFEFDDVNAPGVGSTAGNPHIPIVYDPAVDTQATISDTIVAVVSDGSLAGGTWGVTAFIDAVTGEIRLIDDTGVASALGAATLNPLSARPAHDSVARTLTLTVNPINDPPQFTIPQNPLEIYEDAGPFTFEDFVIDAAAGPDAALDERLAQGLTMTTVAAPGSAGAFASGPDVVLDADGTATLTFNPADNFNSDIGVVEIIVTLTDDGGTPADASDDLSVEQTLTISILSRNDSPEYVMPGTISVEEDAGPQSVNLITNIMPGPATATDEATGPAINTEDQSVTFTAEALDPSLFASGPTIDSATGILTYELNPDVTTAPPFPDGILVRVYAEDDGADRHGVIRNLFDAALVDGGPDTYDGATFTITDLNGNTVVFEFDDVNAAGVGSTGGVPHVAIVYDPAVDTQASISAALVAAIGDGSLAGGAWGVGAFIDSLTGEIRLTDDMGISTDLGTATLHPLSVRSANEAVVRTLTITVDAINDSPEFDLPTNPIVLLEDAGPQTLDDFLINAAAGPADAQDERQSQNLTLTVTTNNPAAFASGPTAVLDADGTATLQFETSEHYNSDIGTIEIIVTLMDDGGVVHPDDVDTFVQTLTIQVDPVNDAPSFVLPITEITVFEDNEDLTGGLDPTVFPGFADSPEVGPSGATDEPLVQDLNFVTVSVSDPSLFEVQPTINADGDLSFVTADNQNGTAIVVVRLMDTGAGPETGLGDENQAVPDQTFTINLTAVNDAPVFTMPTPPVAESHEDEGLVQFPGFLTDLAPGPASATDEVDQEFIVHVNADPSLFIVQPEIAADGTLTYQTARDFNGDILVEVFLTDDGTAGPLPDNNTSPTQTFTISVSPINDAPTFDLNKLQINVNEDVGAHTEPAVAGNISAGPADETEGVRFDIVSVTAPELFDVQPAIDPLTGDLSFTTAANKNGNALVIVQLVDEGAATPPPNDNTSDLKTLTISIAPINDAPEFDIPNPVQVAEDAGLISITGFATNVRRGPAGTNDENSQQVNFLVTATDPGAFSQQPAIAPDGTLTFQTARDVNDRNANLEVKVVLVDNGPSTPPNVNTSIEQTFTIGVTPVNDAPITDAFGASVAEDTAITISAADVLAGDLPGPSDEVAEGQTLIMTQIERTTAQGGTVVPTFNGNEIVSFTYTPPANLAGADTFLYVATDDGTPPRGGSGTITISIAGVNDAPQFTKGADQTVPEDSGAITVDAWATNILAGPPGATDEQATQTVTFEAVADKPELFASPPSIDGTTGTLTFTPATDANGVAIVTVRAKDDGGDTPPNVDTSPAQTFTITITPRNDAPVFTAGPSVTVTEDSGSYSAPWATNIAPAAGLLSTPPTATDEAGQSVNFSLSNDQPNLFAVQPRVTAAGNLEFTPTLDASGSAVVTITAMDSGPSGAQDENTSASQTFTITITAENDAPEAVADNYATDENSVLRVPAPGLLENDTDVDLPNDTLTAVASTTTSSLGAVVVIASDGSITYDPSQVLSIQQLVDGQSVLDTFVYRIQDAEGTLSQPATVSINVAGIDDPPVANDDAYSIGVGQTRLLDVLTNDTDIDSTIDFRTINITTSPIGDVQVNQAGVIEYTAEPGFQGVDTFSYTVRDSSGNVSNEAIVTVTVNNAPVAVNDSTFTFKNESVDIDVLLNDSDPDGTIDPSTVQIVIAPGPAGTAEVLPSGAIRFTPTQDFFGEAQFSYVVSDNVGTPSNVANVLVRVQKSRWQNPRGNLDVNDDGFVSPIDALIITNYLNGGGEPFLPNTGITPPPFLDPNGDEFVTPLDALLVINYLNTQVSGEGEASDASLATSESSVASSHLELFQESYVMTVTPTQIIETVGPEIVREIQDELDRSRDSALQAAAGGWGLTDASDDESRSVGVSSANEESDDLLEKLTCSAANLDDMLRDEAVDDFFNDDYGPYRS